MIDNVVENNGNHGIQTAGNRTLILQNRICENDGHGIDMVGVEQWVIANSIRHNAQRGINDEDNGSTDCFIAENAVIGNGENGIHVVGIGHMLIENTVSLHTGQAPALGIAVIASHSLFFGNKSQENTGTNLIGTVAFNGNLVLANSAEKSQEEGINVTTGAQIGSSSISSTQTPPPGSTSATTMGTWSTTTT